MARQLLPVGRHVTAGNLHVKRVDYLSLEWVIKSYFTGREEHEYRCLESPEFLFGGCSWRLLLHPNDAPCRKISKAEIGLERLDTDIKKHDVSFTIGIKNPDGSVYKSKECKSSMDDKMPVVWFFENDSKVIVLDKKSEVVSEGHLTVFIEDLVLHKRIMDEHSAFPTGEVIINKKNEIKQNDDADDDQAVDDTDSHVEGTDGFAHKMKMLRRNQEDNCDVFFEGDDGFEIRATSTVVMDKFPAFASLFKDKLESYNPIRKVVLMDYARTFNDFLQYIALEQLSKVKKDDEYALYEASIEHKLKHLRKTCIEFMNTKMSIDTMYKFLAIALKHEDREVINCVSNYFALHMQSILPTTAWKNFSKDNHVAANDLIIKALKKNCCF